MQGLILRAALDCKPLIDGACLTGIVECKPNNGWADFGRSENYLGKSGAPIMCRRRLQFGAGRHTGERQDPIKFSGFAMNTGLRQSTGCPSHEHAFSRRALLHGAIVGGAAFGGFGRLFAADSAVTAKQNDKRVILVFMSGGPSQFETWDPKPGAPTGGPHVSIPTSVSGLHYDEFMPNLARLANRMITVRSMTSTNGDHDQGGYVAQTSHSPNAIVAPAPHWLSICAHERPAANPAVPSYVMLGKDNFGSLHVPGSGYLGAKYQALQCPGDGVGPSDLPQSTAEEIAAFERRESLRQSLSDSFAKGRALRPIQSHDGAFQTVGQLLQVGELFDISKEPERDFERYGQSRSSVDRERRAVCSRATPKWSGLGQTPSGLPEPALDHQRI
jgi:hypothetical protein